MQTLCQHSHISSRCPYSFLNIMHLLYNGIRSGSLKHSKQGEKGFTIMKWDFSFHSAYLSSFFCLVCLLVRLELLMMWNRTCQDVAYTHNSTFPAKWGKPPWRLETTNVWMLLNALLNYPVSAFDRMTKGIFLSIEMKSGERGCHSGIATMVFSVYALLNNFPYKKCKKNHENLTLDV